MYKPDDKDIDRLSRHAAEHYRAPGEPSWDALQQVLDKELPVEKEKKRRGFFFFFFLLLGISVAGAGVWYGLHVNTSGKSTIVAGTPNNEKVTAEQEAASTASKNKMAPAENTIASGKNGVAPSSAVEKPAATSTGPVASQATPATLVPADRQDVASNPSATTKTRSNEKNNSVSGSTKKVTLPVRGSSLPAKGRTKHHQSIVLENSDDQKNNDAHNDIAASTHNKNKRGPGTKENPHPSGKAGDVVTPEGTTAAGTGSETVVVPQQQTKQPTASTDTNAIAALPATNKPPAVTNPATAKKDSAVAAKKKNTPPPARAINIGIVAGLDKSTVKFTHGDNVGYNIGIMGGYQFTKHWAVYTGVVYTKKNYTLNGDDYHPPKHYWTQYVQLETVDGYCHMWELPLQARYTFNPSSKTPFFASAGLSSYIMKKQGYTYYFKSNNTPGTAYWTNDSTFNHVFSILHLSAGFEKKLGNRMNLQIEPYAKIPLGGVGFGNIRLSSFGINFSVQYRQPVKR